MVCTIPLVKRHEKLPMMQLSDHVVYEVRDAMMVGKSFSADIKLVCLRFKMRVDSG